MMNESSNDRTLKAQEPAQNMLLKDDKSLYGDLSAEEIEQIQREIEYIKANPILAMSERLIVLSLSKLGYMDDIETAMSEDDPENTSLDEGDSGIHLEDLLDSDQEIPDIENKHCDILEQEHENHSSEDADIDSQSPTKEEIYEAAEEGLMGPLGRFILIRRLLEKCLSRKQNQNDNESTGSVKSPHGMNVEAEMYLQAMKRKISDSDEPAGHRIEPYCREISRDFQDEYNDQTCPIDPNFTVQHIEIKRSEKRRKIEYEVFQNVRPALS